MNWKKVGIVIGHEYGVRVRKKSFILTTILTPIGMALLICVPMLITLFSGNEHLKVKVIDDSGIVAPYFEDSESVSYIMGEPGETVESVRDNFDNLDYYAVVGISPLDEEDNLSVISYSKEPLNMDVKTSVNRVVNKAVETRKLTRYDIKNLDDILADVKSDIKLNSMTLTEDGKAKEDSVEVYMILAYVMAFLIYMFVFMFGTMVMRSVIDEKSSRVVEVIVSSVKSTELMMGKIIGVALVALTQFVIWIVLTVVLVAGASAIAGPELLGNMGGVEQVVDMAGADGLHPDDIAAIAAQNPDASGAVKIIAQLKTMNWGFILGCFLAYFLLGYLLYAAMFAAIGAAVDNESDTGQLQLPVTIPLIIGLFIMLHTFEHPSSQLSFWASIIPWTSPMVMLARIPFGVVPSWQLILSFALLILAIVATIWLSAKIYKVGILTYGKKSTFKDLVKWMKSKD